MNEQRLIRLQRIEIEGLFGLYDPRVDLDHDDRVTLLHGPNGVGKTHTLGMVHALLTGDTGYFRRVPCRQCRLTFANSAGQLVIDPHDDRGELRLDQSGESQKQEIPLVGERRGRLSRSTSPKHPFLSSFEEIPEDHPSGRSTLLRILAENRDLPDWFLAFIKDVNVHFIGTHRLVLAGPSQEPWSNPWSEPWPVPRPNREHPVPTVSERSREFTELFRETMANYGRQAQTLDQTFPQRLVAAQAATDNGDIRRRMAALMQETDQLKCLGILGEASEQPGHPLDEPTELDDTEARVMALYVDDTEKKLKALADLAERVRSLLESLNGKFRHKSLRIDRDEGFVAETDSGQKVPLDSLSSGEQHELVLHYDLLFRVRENTIVLIDEPELSLHVAWQKRFLPDLLDFTKLSAFDATVATHSPYIIGERDDLMVGLSDRA